MSDIPRVGVQEARKKVTAGQALLVCAYSDEAKCRMLNLDGSISLSKFESMAGSVPKSREIIFY